MRCNIIVKDSRRHRYIGFIIRSSTENHRINRFEMINEIRKQCKHILNKDCEEMGICLIRFDGETGIIKCNHVEKENTIKLLKSIDEVSSQKVKIETIGTSGTIKALVKKHMNN